MFQDPDVWMAIGLVLGVLCIPALMSSWANGEPPRATAIAVLVAGGMIAYALMNQPGGYELADIPDVFARVIERYTR
ncbi:MAG: hypothetical protein AAFO58_02540 [Pseudomonadota bacterium]